MTADAVVGMALVLIGGLITAIDRWMAAQDRRLVEHARAEAKARRILAAIERAEAGEDAGRDPESIVPPPPDEDQP